jgi:hypothetical protein
MFVCTLGFGSGIGSAIILLINALCYMRSKGIKQKLIVNIYNASKPVKILITCFFDLPNIHCVKFINIHPEKLVNTIELFNTKEVCDHYNVYHECNEYHYSIFQEIWKIKPQHQYDQQYEKIDISLHLRKGDKFIVEKYHTEISVNKYIEEI